MAKRLIKYVTKRTTYLGDVSKGRRISSVLIHIARMSQVYIIATLAIKWSAYVLTPNLLSNGLIAFVIFLILFLLLKYNKLRSDDPIKRKASLWSSYQMFGGALVAGLPPILDLTALVIWSIVYFHYATEMKH
jgi:hypothetical protein